MLLPYPCLAPHHFLSGTASSHVWNPTCIWHTTTCIWYTTTCLVPHHPCLVSHHPCPVPHLCLVSHHITEKPPQSGTPSCVWNPIPCLASHPVPHCHYLAHSTLHPLAIAAPIWPLAAPYPLIWPLPAHHLELLLHATPTTPSNCHLALMHPAIPSLPAI